MSTRPRWTQDDLDRAEHLFRTSTLPLTAIALESGVPRSTLQLRAEANGWRRCPDWRPMGPPGLAKAVLTTSVNAGERRRDLALRALAAAERQMADIEARAARGSLDVIEEERAARVLAASIRMLRELATLDARAAQSAQALGIVAGDASDPAPARSLEAIRRDFAQRLADLFGGEREGDAPPSGDDAAVGADGGGAQSAL